MYFNTKKNIIAEENTVQLYDDSNGVHKSKKGMKGAVLTQRMPLLKFIDR